MLTTDAGAFYWPYQQKYCFTWGWGWGWEGRSVRRGWVNFLEYLGQLETIFVKVQETGICGPGEVFLQNKTAGE
jgi:hypothetical protein